MILLTGGTGIGRRDQTYETVTELLTRPMPGYGELLRTLSYQQIGPAAMLSRATGGLVGTTVLLTMPGSPAAVRLALERIILPEIGHLVAEATKSTRPWGREGCDQIRLELDRPDRLSSLAPQTGVSHSRGPDHQRSREGPMPRSALLLLLLLLGSGWFFFSYFQFEGLDQIGVRRRDATKLDPQATSSPSYTRESDVIRVATFNLDAFDEVKVRKPHVMRILADMVRRFDVVAVQEIRTASQQLLPTWVEQINADGHAYQYVLGPRQGRTSSKQQYAFLFDSSSIQVDRSACFTVGDPHHLMLRPPLVGSFRVQGVPPEEAFTFVLINVHTNPDASRRGTGRAGRSLPRGPPGESR